MPSPDVQRIIDRILASPRAQGSRVFAGRVYADEPILRTGSQMASYFPERCRQMRDLANTPELRRAPEAKVFYRQAKFMEDYEDSLPFTGEFRHYFPTYQAMGNRQLRGYFTWRAAVRAGRTEDAPTSFMFVYIYELLCGVGVDEAWVGEATLAKRAALPRQAAPNEAKTAEEAIADTKAAGAQSVEIAPPNAAPASNDPTERIAGAGASATTPHANSTGPLSTSAGSAEMTRAERGYWALRDFWGRYGGPTSQIDAYLRTWMRGYVIWHGLDRSLIEPYLDTKFDTSYLALRDGIALWGDRANGASRPSEPAMYAALNALASYKPAAGRLGREHEETLRHVCCDAVVAWAEHCARHRKTGLLSGWFGAPEPMPVAIFAQAVFWSDAPHPDAVYEIDEVNRYICKNGRWAHVSLEPDKKYRSELGMLLHRCDQRLRAALGYKHPLKEKPLPKYLAKIVDGAVETRLAWEREREARTVRVDLSALAGIRAAASTTREALLVDEEREDLAEEPATSVILNEGARSDPEPKNLRGGASPIEAPAEPIPSPDAASSAFGPAHGIAPQDGPAHGIAPQDGPAHSIAAQDDSAQDGAARGIETQGAVAGDTAPYGLTADELALLQALLDGSPWEPPAGTSADMLVDSVNEKLYDLLGDTALEFDPLVSANRPTIIEDYLDDVREAIRP